MNNINVRWRLYVNLLLLLIILITTFQNCSENPNSKKIKSTPLGIEILTE